MTGDRRTCPSCLGKLIKAGRLLCAPCWRAVPQTVQKAVYRTFRSMRDDRANLDKVLAYRAAATEATDTARRVLFDLGPLSA